MKIGFEQVKLLFENLFYKVKVDKDSYNQAWDPKNYVFEQQIELQKKNYYLQDHPADSYIDYNSMVDNLEEEHMRRDVFTTAVEGGNEMSMNPPTTPNDNSVSFISHSGDTPGSLRNTKESPNKAMVKGRAKLTVAQTMATKKMEADKIDFVKRRGPRKKKEVV